MKVAIVGSGPTGVGAASVLIKRGIAVDMFDGGALSDVSEDTRERYADAARRGKPITPPAAPNGAPTFGDLLRRRLSPRRLKKSILGSSFVFDGIETAIPMKGGWLPRSLAVGGLSNVWGTACYPLHSSDYSHWPLQPEDLEPWYREAASLMGVTAASDGLQAAFPLHAPPTIEGSAWQARQTGSALEGHLEDWRQKVAELADLGLVAGRSRLAVRRGTANADCVQCAMCMSGCPVDAMWSSSHAMDSLRAAGVQHFPGAIVRTVEQSGGEVVVTGRPEADPSRHGPYDAVFLAAGPLSSLRIAAQSTGQNTPARLVDNDIYIVPFLSNRQHSGPPTFQLSEAVVTIDLGDQIAHLQLYRPSGPLLGPLSAVPGMKGLTSRLVLGFLYLHSAQSRDVEIAVTDEGDFAPVRMTVRDRAQARNAAKRAFQALHKAKSALGMRPFRLFSLRGDVGVSGHIGGVLPMRKTPGPLETDPNGRLAGDREIYAVDLSVFPEMPAQNPTFTGVANAMRVASRFAERVGAAA